MLKSGLTLALASVLLAAGAATAGDDDDLLKQAKRKKEVAAQRLEAEVREALLDAARLQRSQPGKAAALLRDALRQIEDDANLTPERRAVLRARLRGTIRNLEDDETRQTGRRGEEAGRLADRSSRRADDDRRQTDSQRLSQQMKTIAELRRAGRNEEANRLASDLAARHPDSPALTAARRTASMADRVADARLRREERNERLLGVGREIEKSGTPPIDDLEFPRDWREKSARRSSAIKMTEKERAIMKALDTTIQADLSGTFGQAVDYLQTVTGQTIVLDKQAMDELAVTSDTAVNLKLKRATARTILKKLFAEHGMAYTIKDGTIYVTSAARAKEMLTTRAYYVGDLAMVTDVRFGPFLAQAQAAQAVGLIIDSIRAIEPDTWQPNGPGSITFEPVTMSIIVRQTAEMHFMVGGSLR